MKTVLQKDAFGIVLTLGDLSSGIDGSPLAAHLILNRYLLDDDGQLCLAPSKGFLGILDTIDALKAELDSLGNETVLWFAQNIALRRARFSVITNDDFKTFGGAKGGGGYASGGTPPPHHFSTSSAPTKWHR